ncbi:reverse transcriptase domain-containing protein [Tanacetum coccineum]
MMPPLGFSTPPQIPNITTSKRPPITTTVFAATTPENTPFAYHASTSTNPNPTISPAFVEMEPRLEPRKETTLTLQLRSLGVYRQREKVVGFEDAPNREGNRRGRNAEGIRPSKIEAREGENQRANLSLLLAAHLGRNENSQPLRTSLTSVQGGHQPSTNMGETSLLTTQMGNPPVGGTFAYHPQGGYIPQDFTNNSVPSYIGPIHPTVTPLSSVTPFVRWIEDYPLPDRLKMPSHISSYDRKGDPNNFLHPFEGAIRMQKWLMPVACHMFTYTLNDSARICWNSQETCSILNYKDLKSMFRLHFSQPKKFTKTHLVVHNIKQREGESTRAFITRYTDDTLLILGLHKEQRISGFVHGLRTRSLVKHLSTDLPSTYKGLMEKTYTWVEARETPQNSDLRGCKLGSTFAPRKRNKKERTKSSDTPQGESRHDKGKAPAETPILMVGRVYMDDRSSCEIIYESCFEKLNPTIKATKVGLKTPLVGFP